MGMRSAAESALSLGDDDPALPVVVHDIGRCPLAACLMSGEAVHWQWHGGTHAGRVRATHAGRVVSKRTEPRMPARGVCECGAYVVVGGLC